MAAKSWNKQVVERYVEGFNKLDHAQILSCLTDDIHWTVFGAYRISGKQAYDEHIEGPEFTGRATTTITRMVEEDDVVMAEMTVEVMRKTGELMRAVAGEVFVMRDGKVAERRAYLIELKENDFK
jgi:ketosteroid isomerase-like protein